MVAIFNIFDSWENFIGKAIQYQTKNSSYRFSGITAEDLEGVTTTIRDVQAVLLSMFSSKTILIGHSFESDLKALKMIHMSVVDTSVVFPHKMGPPYKRGLKVLSAELLKRIIQNEGNFDHLIYIFKNLV